MNEPTKKDFEKAEKIVEMMDIGMIKANDWNDAIERVAQALAAERDRVWRLALGAVPLNSVGQSFTAEALAPAGYGYARTALITAAASDGVVIE